MSRRYRYPNRVSLIGFHISDQETLLIYNCQLGANLERFIQERTNRQIGWRMLRKNALDIARALDFMHDECLHQYVKHGKKMYVGKLLFDKNRV
jgi:hypothetical protein